MTDKPNFKELLLQEELLFVFVYALKSIQALCMKKRKTWATFTEQIWRHWPTTFPQIFLNEALKLILIRKVVLIIHHNGMSRENGRLQSGIWSSGSQLVWPWNPHFTMVIKVRPHIPRPIQIGSATNFWVTTHQLRDTDLKAYGPNTM
jgi:hypothetical protein